MSEKTAMFTTRQAPWMKLGTVIDEPVDAATAARMGGMDFGVELRPAGHLREDGKWIRNGRFDVVADDTGESFDTVTKDYVPVQFAEAFGFMDKVDRVYVAAGTMKGRKQGFLVVQVPGAEKLDLNLKGEVDPHELFAVLRTSHDRSRGLEVAIMALRGKCMNQLTLPTFATDAKQRWSIRHVGDPHAKLAAATDVIRGVERYADAYANLAQELVEQELLVEEVEQLLKSVLDDRPKRDEQVSAIIDAWQHSDTVGFAGTGWGVVQATSEYFEWGRESGIRTPQSRFLGGLDGTTHKVTGKVAQQLRLRAVRTRHGR